MKHFFRKMLMVWIYSFSKTAKQKRVERRHIDRLARMFFGKNATVYSDQLLKKIGKITEEGTQRLINLGRSFSPQYDVAKAERMLTARYALYEAKITNHITQAQALVLQQLEYIKDLIEDNDEEAKEHDIEKNDAGHEHKVNLKKKELEGEIEATKKLIEENKDEQQ